MLATLQQDVMAALQGRTDTALSQFAGGRGIDPATGLRIYTHAYGARLREALESDHPILGRYLGDTLWDDLCAGYIAAYPSRYRSLRHFGSALPAWLAQAEPFRAHPVIAEIAGFERLLLDVFDAPDAARASPEMLQSLPAGAWPSLQLRFHPSLQRYSATSNAVDIWKALKNDAAPPTAMQVPGEWVLWRDSDHVTRFRPMELAETGSLDLALHGGDFAGLCECLLAWHPPGEVPAQALGLLQRWLQEGWIRSVVSVTTDTLQQVDPA